MRTAELGPEDGASVATPMGLLEVVGLVGGLLILVQGFGVVIGRLSGTNTALLACLSPFFYIAAGFIAGRYATIANGVWAGIAVAVIDTVMGMCLSLLDLPSGFGQMRRQLAESAPAALIAIVIVLAVIGMTLYVLIAGSLCGAIGAAIGQSRPFRPRDGALGR